MTAIPAAGRGIWWDLFFPRFILRLLVAIQMRPRLVMTLEALFVFYVVLFAWAPPAVADPGNPLSGLDRADSTGHMISNYNVNFQVDGFGIGPFFTAGFGVAVSLVWELYRWLVGIAALLVAFTLTFEWVDWLAHPVEQAATTFQDVLDQVPMGRELLFILAVGIGLVRMYFGQGAKGFSEILFSLTAWGVSAAIVVNPVTWLVGDHGIVTSAKEMGQSFVAELVDSSADASTADPAAAPGKLAAAMVDIFIRKPHQFIAYGALADGGGCEATYNANLAKSGDDLATAMATCSPDFAETITHPGPLTLVTMLIVLVGGAILLAMACAIAGFAIFEIANILLGGLTLVWELFRSVGPAGSWRGALYALMGIAGSVLLLLLGLMLNVMYLSVVQYFFSQHQENTILLFLLVDVVMVISVLVLMQQRKKVLAAIEKMRKRSAAGQAAGRPGPASLNARAMRKLVAAAALPGAVNLARPVGSKLAHATSSAAAGTGRAVRGGSRIATTPARALTRSMTRPGRADGNRVIRMLNWSGGASPAAKRQIRATAFAQGEKKWMDKEAKREARAEQRAERRKHRQARSEQNRSWTWGGARRTALRQDGKSAREVAAQQRARKRARSVAEQSPVDTHPQETEQTAPTRASEQARRPRRRSNPGQRGSDPSLQSQRGQTGSRQPQRRPAPGQGGSASRSPAPRQPNGAGSGQAKGVRGHGPAPEAPLRTQGGPAGGQRTASQKGKPSVSTSRSRGRSRRRKK